MPSSTDIASSAAVESATRCYLRNVYSGAKAPVDDRPAQHLVSSLRLFYSDVATTLCGLDLRNTTRKPCKSTQRELVRRDDIHFLTFLGRCVGSECERHALRYVPPWSRQIHQGIGENQWIEVQHFGLAGKVGSRVPTSWREFLDGGLAGWWYYRAPGSGIFYRTGATRVASNKVAMLIMLSKEWADSGALRQSKF